jgi:hypothetical protein
MANPKILGLIPKYQIRKFLRWASPQIANTVRKFYALQYFQIANLRISKKYCTTLSQNSSKVVFLKGFLWYVHILIRALNAVFVRRNNMYLRTCGGLSPQITKKIGSAIRNSVKSHICGRSTNLTNLFKSENLRICDLRNLFADRPPLLMCLQPLNSLKHFLTSNASQTFFLTLCTACLRMLTCMRVGGNFR